MREIRFVLITYYSSVQSITRFVFLFIASILSVICLTTYLKCLELIYCCSCAAFGMGGTTCLAQLHDFDMCVAKNEEALRIEPHFAECYGNMANAWKVNHCC